MTIPWHESRLLVGIDTEPADATITLKKARI